MKHSLKHIILGILIVTYTTLHGQANRWQEVKAKTDSSQRTWMRQVLQLNDSLITNVFMIRDNMYQEINSFRSNKSILEKEQDDKVLAVRKKTETAIRATMGQKTYQLYTERIRQRLNKAGNTQGQPLTGTGN